MSWPNSLLSWLVGLGAGSDVKCPEGGNFAGLKTDSCVWHLVVSLFRGRKGGHQKGLVGYLVIISALDESWLIEKDLANLTFNNFLFK